MKVTINEPFSRHGLADLINTRGYKVGVEVGVDTGAFSYWLLAKSNLRKLHSVDPWTAGHVDPQSRYEAVLALLTNDFGARSQVWRSTSVEVAAALAASNTLVDFVYVDGSHRKRAVQTDIGVWWPRLASGGCLAGHDYDLDFGGGVVAAVSKFAKRQTLHLTNEPHWKSWFVFKA